MAIRRQSSAAASPLLPPVAALLFLWMFGGGRVMAHTEIRNMTALQKHVSFFDRNKDGIITPSETFEGSVAIGFNVTYAREFATLVHAANGPITSPADAPLPHLSIYIENMHKGMHGSDTGAFDVKGRFVPQKFEEIFVKHAKTRPDGLTYLELEDMILANRDPLDPASWEGPQIEWGGIYNVASDNDGFLHKDDARGIYDGSVFVKLEEKRGFSHHSAM
ncbi:probable peroxygenase 5 [Triticum dicoccoides]|uniref:probable peroxygenase 5 n=1 Tax=Triticum dicoccoides TaxID=85692 RepID=UPI000E7CE5FC|nr:probable peroxygenase 5 [Triticum dicoccoides]